MFTSTIAAGLSALLCASSAVAAPATAAPTDSGPKIIVTFFSDSACNTTIPSTIYTRYAFGDHGCYNDFGNAANGPYSSLIINEIDDQFIGANTALIVGNTASATCDFTHSLKYSVANRDTVGECQFIGIPQGMGKPDLPGNEYELGPLEG